MNNWKQRLANLKSRDTFDPDMEIQEEQIIQGDRVCMTNDSGSMITINENGRIDVRGSSLTGMTIDKESGTVMMSGKKLSLMFEEIDMYTLPFKWRHNKFTINTLPIYTPGMGMILPDAPQNLLLGIQNISNKLKKIL